MEWLLKQEVARDLVAQLGRTMPASADQRAMFNAECADGGTTIGAARSGRLMNTAGSVAEIAVTGVLVKQPSFVLWLLGYEQTAYSDIVDALGAAALDATVKSVVLKVDSPGGSVDGLFETLAAIQAFDKPMSVLATQACSAAYAISAVAGKITATSVAAQFGSIGVAASITIDKDTVELTSTEAPEKRPNVQTEEGKAVVVRYLDAVHDLFVDAISKGRDTTAANVNSSFGRGSVLLAADAKSRGMVDVVAKPKATSKNGIGASAADDQPQQEGSRMDLRTLRTQHPELYEQACAEGAKVENERVQSHLTMGQAGGDEGMRIALEAIEKGTAFNSLSMAKYQVLALNKRDRGARQEDDSAVAQAVNGAKRPTDATPPASGEAAGGDKPAPDMGDKVVSLLKGLNGRSAPAAMGGK